MFVTTAAEMREIDRATIEDAGIPGLILMDNAGRQVADAVLELLDGDLGPVCVLCGKGNNGGDGFVAARYLYLRGVEVICLLITRREEVTGDALTQLDIVDTLGITVLRVDKGLEENAEAALSMATVIVDALFGTGLSSPLRGPTKRLVEHVNSLELPVVSVDLPSGISADTGAILGVAIQATVTVTFGLPKRGLLVHPGLDHAGDLITADIGIPPEVVEHVAPSCLLNTWERPFLPTRQRDAHKGSFGHVLVIGGSPGKGGAALLAGMAALRLGAGLVTVLTDRRCQPALEGRYPELMVVSGWDPDQPGLDGLPEALRGKDAIVIGPGLEPSPRTAALLQQVLQQEGLPVVVDAGALTLLEQTPGLLPTHNQLILTPHPGEAARLLGTTSGKVQADRFQALERLVKMSGAVVALKGARTLVGAPDAPVTINPTGNPGMASGGTGDILAGMMGALLTRDLSPLEVANVAVYLHGLAGDRAAELVGEESLIATDLLAALPEVLRGTRTAAP